MTIPPQSDLPQEKFLATVTAPLTYLLGPATWENALGWLKIVAAVLLIEWVWFQPFMVPSASMDPTLKGDPSFFVGDRVAVNKHQYGIRVPFMNKLLFRCADPKRWDIVVFNSPDPKAVHPILVKRIVGLPGERIHIREGKVFVNGKALELPEGMPPVFYTSGDLTNSEDVKRHVEQSNLPPELRPDYEAKIMRAFVEASGMPNFKYGVLLEDEYSLIPADHYLMLGDNSSNSADGRVFGWTPRENLIGPVFAVWWPTGHARDFTGFSKTWWGGLLLYGLPGFLVFYEVVGASFMRSWRVSQAMPGEPFKKGDRVLVNQAAFGVRAPLLGVRLTTGRVPRRGELVFYYAPDERGVSQMCAGRICGLPGETVEPAGSDSEATACAVPAEHYYVQPPAEDAAVAQPMWVAHRDLCGSVLAVWWPLWRVRSFGGETTMGFRG